MGRIKTVLDATQAHSPSLLHAPAYGLAGRASAPVINMWGSIGQNYRLQVTQRRSWGFKSKTQLSRGPWFESPCKAFARLQGLAV